MESDSIKVVVFPLRDNPYQKYLYDLVETRIGSENIFYFSDIDVTNRSAFIKFVLGWPFKLQKISGSKKVFHFHWQFFYFLINKKVRNIPSIILCLWILSWIKVFNFKIVWTVHDYNQHDTDSSLDETIRKIMLKFVSKVIVLNSITRDMLNKNDHVSMSKMSLIPIGNYGNDSRYVPKKDSSTFDFVFFGLVRKYKGVERLISAFKSVSGQKFRLKIYGGCYDKEYFKQLVSLANNDNRIDIKDTYLSQEDLDILIHNSDVSVLPFLEVTNSSSAMLSYSKGRPVIAPLIGAFREHPSQIGFFYENNTEQELIKAMRASASKDKNLIQMGKEALKYSKTFQWPKIADQTVTVYKELF